jgi:hypothetical protein
MKYTDVKLGDKLKVLETNIHEGVCIHKGEVLEVKQDPNDGALYVDCGTGEHYLTYDVNAHKELIGFEPV